MQITVLATQINKVPTAKGSYDSLEVTYKDGQGKTASKKLMSFVAKAVFPVLSKAQQGDTFEIVTVKNDKGYWDWTSATPASESSTPFPTLNTEVSTTAKPTAFAGKTTSNYATPEERALTQVYIVRQSSLKLAVDEGKKDRDVFLRAAQLEEYVFNGTIPPEETKKTTNNKKKTMEEDLSELEQLDEHGFPV